MHTYTGYGLTIDSEIELPAFTPASGTPDVTIRAGRVDRAPDEEEREIGHTYASPDRYYVAPKTVGTIEVRAGTHITLDLQPGAPLGVVQTLVSNLAFGVLLHQRKVLTFHASAVSINGRVVAFVGEKGWGKSTMASALYRRGHDVITDDVLGLNVRPAASPEVFPGVAQLKLWPDAITGALGEEPEGMERIHADSTKRIRQLDVISPEVKPLARIYVLGGAEEVHISGLAPRSAFLQLLPHAYTKRILQATDAERWHLDQVTQLANQGVAAALRRPHDLGLLPDIADRIEADVLE